MKYGTIKLLGVNLCNPGFGKDFKIWYQDATVKEQINKMDIIKNFSIKDTTKIKRQAITERKHL